MRFACLLALAWLFAPALQAQVIAPGTTVGGVSISTEGTLQIRADAGKHLTAVRTAATQAGAQADLAYISLPRLFAQAQKSLADKQPLPEDLRYLHGLTQIRYVFVYPQEKDLVIAGPAEAYTADNPLQPLGKVTGRPVLQFDDLVTAFRAVANAKAGDFYGCSLDTVADSQKVSDDIAKKYADRPRPELVAALKKALGPQKVTLYGLPADSRLAFATLAADYRLKRMTMGLETVPGIASAVDSSRASTCRFWFEPAYAPLLVSADGNAYEIRGPRLKLLSGQYNFDPRGATPAAEKFAQTMTDKMPELAARVDAFADLQNVADLLLLAALVRHDQLDTKAGWDTQFLLAADQYQPASLAVAKQAETQVSIQGNAVASGGVSLSVSGLVEKSPRDTDKTEAIVPLRKRPAEQAWFVAPKP